MFILASGRFDTRRPVPMKDRLPLVLLTMSLLSFLGCSPTTQDLPAKLTELHADVQAEHQTSRYGNRFDSRQSLRVVLSNGKGAALERSDVGVEVNGRRMRFRVSQGNYYDRHPYYTLDADDHLQLAPGTDCRFVLVLPDGTRHDIGILRMPAALQPDQFEFPSKPPTSGPVSIAWRDLAEPVQLRIGRAEQRREPDGQIVTEGAGPYDSAALRRTIGPGWFRSRSDRWAIPTDYLVSTPERKLLWLEAEMTAATEGRPSSFVSKRSTLQAKRSIRLQMEFDEIK